MPISPGAKLGPYEILAPIGAGGMGEVYKARDARLDRTVAIKVLPSHLSDNAELKQRFEREARAVSSLNHPHICTLYDIGQQEGVDYLVMEYLEGETLADRLKKGALPLDQALSHAIEIADALDKAHRQGVVHRDLKPGNIMITKEGAKLLDFGLAKLRADVSVETSSMLSALPTEEKPLTEKGSIIGTFQYMAPEQLEGKDADARTDIFAFGAVVHETVTGRKAFEGKSQASLIGAIMTSDPPPISRIQTMSPPALDHLVKTCLAKDPDNRWQTAGDVERQLKWIAEGGSQAGVSEPLARRPSRSHLAWVLVVGLMAGALAAGITVWSVTRPGPRPPLLTTRFVVTLPATDRLDNVGIALSSEGRDLVYVANRDGVTQLYRRSLDQLEAVPIRGTEGASYPFFSPDGKWIGFFADGKLKKVSLAGGPPVTLCDAGYRFGASWGRNDVILFASREYPGLMQVSASGGAPERLTTPENEQSSHRWLEVLPRGKAVLFTVFSGSLENARIAVQSLETGEQRMLVDGAHPRYSPTGHIVFARVDSLWAVPFDADRLQVTGSPTPALEGVQVNTGGLANFALAGDGSLVYFPSSAQAHRKLVWVDRQGNAAPLTEKRGSYRYPRLSPDGGRLAVEIGEEGGSDIWIHDIGRDTLSRLSTEGNYGGAAWSPDGNWLAFSSRRGAGSWDLYRKRADFSGQAEVILAKEYTQWPHTWSPDGTLLTYVEFHPSGGLDIGVLPLEGEREPRPILQTSFGERSPTFSPHGGWIAYQSDESGRYEIYVQPFPGPGRRWPISTDGGNHPVWSARGRELFYLNGQKMMAVDVETQPEFRAGTPRLLFEGSHVSSGNRRNYDVAPDGRRFVMIQQQDLSEQAQIHVVLNWLEELKQLVPTEHD